MTSTSSRALLALGPGGELGALRKVVGAELCAWGERGVQGTMVLSSLSFR